MIENVQADEVVLGNIGEGTGLIQGESEIYSEGVIAWEVIVSTVAQVLFFAAAVATFIYLIWGGLTFISSGGKPEKVAEARRRITYAAIGLIITACAFVIWQLILGIVGAESLNPGL